MKANFSVMNERSIFAGYDVMMPVQKLLAGNSYIVLDALSSLLCDLEVAIERAVEEKHVSCIKRSFCTTQKMLRTASNLPLMRKFKTKIFSKFIFILITVLRKQFEKIQSQARHEVLREFLAVLIHTTQLPLFWLFLLSAAFSHDDNFAIIVFSPTPPLSITDEINRV